MGKPITQHNSPKPILHHAMKRIIISHNNRKKHGAYPVEHKTSEGCISSEGQVVLFVRGLEARGFLSLGEMKEELGEYGDVDINYVDNDAVPDLPALSLLSKIVLRDLIQNGLLEHKVHDITWFYAINHDKSIVERVEPELKALIDWLEDSEKQ